MVMQEQIIIEGISHGVKFIIPLVVHYEPATQTIEEGIIQAMGGTIHTTPTFEQLAISNGWSNAHWTYPNNTFMGAI